MSTNERPFIVTSDQRRTFERPGFVGGIIIERDDARGFDALTVDVASGHPAKQMGGDTTRVYHVIEGEGTFVLDGIAQAVKGGDTVVLPPGSTYSYDGPDMRLFEFNISPSNTFSDRQLP